MNEINDLFQQLVSQITTLEIVIKGMIIGIVASAPMGPVGVLCIQRTLNKGRAYGLVTGTGAALPTANCSISPSASPMWGQNKSTGWRPRLWISGTRPTGKIGAY